MSKTLGMVCARKGSKRFTGKNTALIGSITLVEKAVRTLSRAGLDDIVVATDFPLDFDLSQYKAIHLLRPQNISDDNVALQETVKWAYLSLNESYENIAFLMPNCPMIEPDTVKHAIALLCDHNYNVVRSYNPQGLENGLIAAKTEYLLSHYIDVYCGACICDGDEIHDEQDYLRIKKMLETSNDTVG